MIEFSQEDFITKPYPYQLDGLKFLLSRKNAAIFDEMGVGKTKQVIDAASILYQNNIIDGVIVVAPASARGTWDNPHTGQIHKHCASDYIVYRYDNKFGRSINKKDTHLLWLTISYSFLRARLQKFMDLIEESGKKFLLVLDESAYIKSPSSKQTKACKQLRTLVNRCIIMNGTPVANHVMDLWAQFWVLDHSALKNLNYYHFRARYAIMGGYKNKQVFDFDARKYEADRAELANLKKIKDPRPAQLNKITSLENSLSVQERVRDSVENLKEQLKPWVIRREKKDVLKDLPEILPPVYLEAPMTRDGYKVYTEMLEEMVAWANSSEYSSAPNGAVKLARLSQITSGFLGGLTTLPIIEEEHLHGDGLPLTKEVDDAKLKTFLEWYENNRELKVLVWCRFRAEMFRLRDALEALGVRTAILIGGQSNSEREEGIAAFSRGERDIMIANPSAGGFGIDGLQNHCHTIVNMSLDHSLIKYEQSRARIHRNGQNLPVNDIYIMAMSPDGTQETVDHLIVNALTNKQNIAEWTMDKWRDIVKSL